MGRAPRAEFSGALYHVFARGNRREPIFLDEDDYQSYVERLRTAAERMGVAVIAYCLMPNHPHLCLRTDGTPLSVFMQRLNTRHARRFNDKYELCGHLHQGRYQALLVDEETYLLRLVRYIHQNPVRAGLVKTLEGWRFSSHRDYLSETSWLDRQPVLSHFVTRADYKRFMAQPAEKEDLVAFSKTGLGVQYAGTTASVKQVFADTRAHREKAPLLWLPVGESQPAASTQTVESDAARWLREHGQDTSLEEVQSHKTSEPTRGHRRALATWLRRERHTLRAIALLLRRDIPSINRLISRAERPDVKSDT